MKIALCNEVLREWPLDRQAGYAAALGYDGLEIAPFTLSPAGPGAVDRERAARARATVEAEGIVVSGLHWLLVAPEGLSITDPARKEATATAMADLVMLCEQLGGRYLIHGSPQQRAMGTDPELAWATARDHFAAVAILAETAGVDYLLEPLSRDQTDFLNTLEEADRMVREVDASHSLAAMLDTCSAAKTETRPLPELIEEHVASGLVRHIHFNDPNLRAPGQGALDFAPLVATLERIGYEGWVAVEPFDYVPDGPACAARAIGTLRALEARPRP